MNRNAPAQLDQLLRPEVTATIVIDMQNDFCSAGGALDKAGRDTSAARSIIPAVSNLVKASRQAGVPVIYIRSLYTTPNNTYLSDAWMEAARRRGDGLYTDIPICVEGSWGAEIVPELTPEPEDTIITKHRFSAFINTPLGAVLRAKKRSSLVFAGTVTYVCVESTVRDAFHLDFHNVVPSDCVAGWNQDLHRSSLQVMEWGFATITNLERILQIWQTTSV